MKKLLIVITLVVIYFEGSSEPYSKILARINKYLKSFDNGYYGKLSIVDGTLYDYYKNGLFSKIAISDIDQAKIETENRQVIIFCKYDNKCVVDGQGSTFYNMPFTSNNDFDTKKFAQELNDLFESFKKAHPVPNNKMITKVDFPAGTKVIITQEDKPYNLLEALREEEELKNIGTVVEDLVPLGDGWYKGSIKGRYDKIRTFEKAKISVVK